MVTRSNRLLETGGVFLFSKGDKTKKQIGDYLYTINDIGQIVSIWKICEINGDRYICENKRTDKIREFSKDDPSIFDTEEAAMKVIKKTKMKKGLIMAGFFLFMAVIMVIIVLFQILSGNF